MSFKNLNLDQVLEKAVEKCGFTDPTPVQAEAIPPILAGHDVMACAQTGTGKTAAFVLPALQRLLGPARKNGLGPRVLVLTPTRELALQVKDNITKLGRFGKVKTGIVVGGMPYPPQIKMLRESLDILVATPGRLIDHMNSGRVMFNRVEMLILDEADRMLDMGFIDDVNTIVSRMPAQRQTLLFSATFEGKVKQVATNALTQPVQIKLARSQQKHLSIEQHMHLVDNAEHKNELLSYYFDAQSLNQAIVFTATKRSADNLARVLSKHGHASESLHGDMSQNKRKRTLERMHRGNIRILVATDVAARGLDIKGISHVFNYDLPRDAEDYIHRVGRTGRGGDTGTAVSLVSTSDWTNLLDIEKLTGQSITRKEIEGLEPSVSEPVRRPGKKKKPGQRRYQGKSAKNAGRKPGRKTTGKSAQANKSKQQTNHKNKPRSAKGKRRTVA